MAGVVSHRITDMVPIDLEQNAEQVWHPHREPKKKCEKARESVKKCEKF